jgi:hypothetical protein
LPEVDDLSSGELGGQLVEVGLEIVNRGGAHLAKVL